MENLVAFTKKLLNEGYTQRQVAIITGQGSSWIQRIAARKTYNDVSMNDYDFDGHLEIKKHTLDLFLGTPEFAGAGALDESDLSYLKVLKYCGVPYSAAKNVYFDRSHQEFRRHWDYINRTKLPMFDGKLLNIRPEIMEEIFGRIFDL